MKALANVVSWLCHPLLVTTYLFLVIGWYFPAFLAISGRAYNLVLAFIICFTVLLPSVNILMFRFFGTISSLTLQQRKERVFPFFAIAVVYVVMTVLFFYKLPISLNFNKLIAISTCLVVASVIVTFFYKISIHSLAWGGFVGILVPLNKAVEYNELVWPIAGVLAVTGAVMSARLYLQAHTLNQVLTGAALGFIMGIGGIILLF